MGYVYIALTLLFTVYGQLVLKWQIVKYGALPETLGAKVLFLGKVLLNPWVLSGFASAFLASLFWMAAMTKFPLSHAYPFMSLAFVIVMVFSMLFLGEALTLPRAIGTITVVAGLYILTR